MDATTRRSTSTVTGSTRTSGGRQGGAKVLYELRERLDLDKGSLMLAGEVMLNMKATDEPTFAAIQDTITVAKHLGGFVSVQYYMDAVQDDFGRMKARVLADGVNAVPYVRMKRDARAHLASKYYLDIDMANCQPSLFQQMLDQHLIPCPLLRRYNSNRDTSIDEVMDACGVDRAAAKSLFIRLMFFGGVNGWLTEHPAASADKLPAWVLLLKDEMRHNAEMLLCKEEFTELKKHYSRRASLDSLHDNKTASLMALHLQSTERACVCALVDAIQADARSVGGIIYDGVLVERDHPGETSIDPNLLAKWARYVRVTAHYDVQLVVKPWNNDPAWLVPASTTPALSDVGACDGAWDDSWMTADSITTYADMKRHWERRTFKVTKGGGNYVREDRADRQVLSEKQLHDAYRHLSFAELHTDANGALRVTQRPFIARWINDKHIRTHRELVIAPPPLTPPPDAYNLWTDVAAARYQASPGRAVDPDSEAVRFIRAFVEILCCHNVRVVKYLFDWMAQLFQEPAKKTGIALLLKGVEGVGKNRLTDLLRLMLGPDKFMQTASPGNSLYGRFTRPREGKLLIVINEANGSDNFAANDIIKDMITCDEFISEGKGTNSYPINCFARFIFTTNNDNCLKVNPDSRRYVVVDVSSELKGNTQYFRELSALIDDAHVRHELYCWLMARDVSQVDWINSRPITDGQLDMAAMNLPYEHQFVKHIAIQAIQEPRPSRPPPAKWTVEALYDEFKTWADHQRISLRHDMNFLKFARSVAKLAWDPIKHCGFKAVRKEKVTKGVRYTIDYHELFREMQAKHWLCRDEMVDRRASLFAMTDA